MSRIEWIQNVNHCLKCLLDNDDSHSTLTLWSSGVGLSACKQLAGALAKNKSCTALYLGNNCLNDEGAAEIADALRSNRTLTCLDLKFNGISEEGARLLSEALDKNSTLTTLELVETGCTQVLMNEMYKADADGKIPDVQYNKISLAMHMRIQDQLTRNCINDTIDQVSDDKKDFIYLNLGRKEMGMQCAEYLAVALDYNKNLTALNLENNVNIGSSGIGFLKAALCKHRSLTSLNFRHCNIGDEGAIDVAEILDCNDRIT